MPRPCSSPACCYCCVLSEGQVASPPSSLRVPHHPPVLPHGRANDWLLLQTSVGEKSQDMRAPHWAPGLQEASEVWSGLCWEEEEEGEEDRSRASVDAEFGHPPELVPIATPQLGASCPPRGSSPWLGVDLAAMPAAQRPPQAPQTYAQQGPGPAPAGATPAHCA